MGTESQAHVFDIVWVYDNGVEAPTGQRITLQPQASDTDILSAMQAAGFHGQKVSRRESSADPVRVLTTNGVMVLRSVAGDAALG